jgi:hypothetical protein
MRMRMMMMMTMTMMMMMMMIVIGSVVTIVNATLCRGPSANVVTS